MANYQEKRVTLTNTLLNKLKSAAKNNKGGILRLNRKNLEDEELLHELLVTTIQTGKVCNIIANNTSTDTKLSKDQILKFSQGSVTVL